MSKDTRGKIKCNYSNINYYLCEHSKTETQKWTLINHGCSYAMADMLSEDIYCSYGLNEQKHIKNEFAEVGE